MVQELSSRASRDEGFTCFLGAGSYDHHVPAAVWDLASRGEFNRLHPLPSGGESRNTSTDL